MTDGEKVIRSRLVSSVTATKVQWLWPGRLPLGKLCVLDGDPGLGKSTMLLDLAARVSTGGPMPDETSRFEPSSVVLMSAEDGAGDTIRPRLEAADADLDRIVLVEDVEDEDEEGYVTRRPPHLPRDVNVVAALVEKYGASLLIVDPLAAYLTGVDSYKDNDVRRALHPLKELAEQTNIAIVVLRHLSKTGGSNPLYRGGGSIGIIGAARAGLLVAKDPDDDTRRIVAITKSNLAMEPPALAYRLVSDEEFDVARVVWEGTTAHRAADLLVTRDDDEQHGARDEAAEFLRDLLADGPVSAKEAMTKARACGIATITLKRAKKTVGVRSRKHGHSGEWSWELESIEARGSRGSSQKGEPLEPLERGADAEVIPLDRGRRPIDGPTDTLRALCDDDNGGTAEGCHPTPKGASPASTATFGHVGNLRPDDGDDAA